MKPAHRLQGMSKLCCGISIPMHSSQSLKWIATDWSLKIFSFVGQSLPLANPWIKKKNKKTSYSLTAAAVAPLAPFLWNLCCGSEDATLNFYLPSWGSHQNPASYFSQVWLTRHPNPWSHKPPTYPSSYPAAAHGSWRESAQGQRDMWLLIARYCTAMGKRDR